MKVQKRLSYVFKGVSFNDKYIELFIDNIFLTIYTDYNNKNHFHFEFSPFDPSIPTPFPTNYFIEIAKQIQEEVIKYESG
jgi:hypothetical protein